MTGDRQNRREMRVLTLLALYELSGADVMEFIEFEPIAQRLGFDGATVERIARQLVEAGWAKFPESGPVLCITYPGIDRVECLVEASVDHPLRADVAARKERRVHLLEFLDRASDGDPSRTVSNFGDLGFGQPELYSLAGYLGARGFVAFAGHELAITGLGIRALDEASTDPTLRF